jgi:hypothetical protein
MSIVKENWLLLLKTVFGVVYCPLDTTGKLLLPEGRKQLHHTTNNYRSIFVLGPSRPT